MSALGGTHAPVARQRHWVYRLYNVDSAVIYVGCTSAIGSRLTDHSRKKPWWSEVCGVEVEQHKNMRDGLDAERAAIEALQPKYNLVYTDRAPKLMGGWVTRRARMADAHARGVDCLDWTCVPCRTAAHASGVACTRGRRCVKCQNAPVLAEQSA